MRTHKFLIQSLKFFLKQFIHYLKDMLCSSHAFHNYFCVTIKKRRVFLQHLLNKALAPTNYATVHRAQNKRSFTRYVIVKCLEAYHHDDNCFMWCETCSKLISVIWNCKYMYLHWFNRLQLVCNYNVPCWSFPNNLWSKWR